MDLAGKVIILTGASSGIGEQVGVDLARQGAKLALAARRKEKLDAVADRCRQAGGEAIVVPTDVADQDQCERLIDETVAHYGKLDVLINNAGISMWTRFDEIKDLSIFEKMMRINYLGAVYCTHFALPYIKQSRGLLVAVSSLTGKTGVPKRSAYGASKHAMQGFFDSIRIELEDDGVDVLVVSPGFVETEIRAKAIDGRGVAHGESKRDESKPDTMTVEECSRQIVDAIRERKREVVMTLRGKVGMWVKLFAPGVIDRVAKKALEEK
jgi:short-subunit dehydrogenase